jgi:hypothetical protein
MANEYLKRTPTSTGNRRVWTWSGWIKQPKFNGSTLYTLFSAYSSGYPNRSYFVIDSDGRLNVITYEGAYVLRFYSQNLFRDNSSWTNILFSVDTTKGNGAERVSLFSNGAKLKIDETNYNEPSINYQTYVNLSSATHGIGYDIGLGGRPYDGHMTDVFFIDGQALTPEVFGFYKDGNGYISAGSTQSTDFRNGQWVPRTPREIKNLINDNGGFGVNGFYLPMNDSSNFGADFHTTPNSIITLKGENLPQPRNGAPETTDAYVSQLRTDPYAANLVLAVPGISTATGPELVTNGDFSNGTSGWTLNSATGTLSVVNGELFVEFVSTNGANCIQTITTEIGKSYKVSVTSRTATSNQPAKFSVGTSANTSDLTARINNNDTTNKIQTASFVATSTTTYLTLGANYTSDAYFDNISVREVNIPTDYSADIKGSGSNKTLTVNGGAGIADHSSYYGSALSFDGTGDYFDVASSSDYNLGTSDYTIECWVNPTTITTTGYYKRIWDLGTGLYNSLSMTMQSTDNSFKFRYNDGILLTSASNSVNTSQWSHICLERYGSQLSLYLNGTTVGIVTNHTASYDYSSNTFRIGQTHESGSNGEASSVNGYIQDLRIYKGVAKYKGGFDVPKPYTPVGIEAWRAVPDTCQNNFATWNPLWDSMYTTNNASFSDGNLKVTGTNSDPLQGTGTVGVSTGKWYYETRATANPYSGSILIGIRPAEYFTSNAQNRTSYRSNGRVFNDDGSTAQSGTTYTTGDIIGVAFDMNTKKLWFSKNGSWVYSGNPEAGTSEAVSLSPIYTNYTPFFAFDNGSGTEIIDSNFGQNPTFSGTTTAGTYTDSNGKGLFKYQPPSGFLALCEDNLPTPTIKDPGEYFKTVLYTGDNSAGRRINVGFQPDLIWFKSRNTAVSHILCDSVRGFGHLNSNGNNVESTSGTLYLSGYADNGFDLNNGASSGGNTTGRTYVAWCWKAGGPTVTNTDGSIISQVSANQTAGFSIVSWTSTGSNDALQTVGHGLNTAPNMIILKNRDASVNWRVYHSGITSGNSLTLNATEASYSFWPSVGNDTFGLANSTTTGQASGTGNQDIIAYCWSEIEGFSKFGSYVGNGNADGSFVYCGFKPAFVMLKASSTTGNWCMIDNARNSTNPTNFFTVANASNNGDDTGGALDFLSNGFKLRLTSSNFNGNGVTYIFAAFAESPYKYANSK